jgi:membrane fusion protein, multidrug efflux system
VGDDNKVAIENVKVGDRIGSQWVIDNGLQAGQSVIVDGAMKVGPGLQVNPKPFVETASGKGR